MFSTTSIALRVVGLVLGFLVGLRVSASEYKQPGMPATLYPPSNQVDGFSLVIFSLIVAIIFKIVNYFFNDDNNAGIGEYMGSMFVGVVFGIVYHWFF
jgi:hypothetical protein